MKGDQFRPYEPPFMKRWRAGLEGKNAPRPTKELDKVVKKIKTMEKKKKPPFGGCG